MLKKDKKIWGSGQIKIHDIELDCCVLNDWTPMLNSSKLAKALGRPNRWSRSDELPAMIDAKWLEPFIKDGLREKLIPYETKDIRNRKVVLFEADILPLICNVYLEAREAWVLKWNQIEVAQKCEALMRAFANVGIRALIYEQLGFERMKNPDAYRMLIESYLSEQERLRQKEFPDEFYIQLDRIYWNEKTTSRNRPLYYAKFTRKYIYDPIMKWAILEELDKRNPTNKKWARKVRHHQLTSDKWLANIKAQVRQVIWLLKASANKSKFENNYKRMLWHSVQETLFE